MEGEGLAKMELFKRGKARIEAEKVTRFKGFRYTCKNLFTFFFFERRGGVSRGRGGDRQEWRVSGYQRSRGKRDR